MILKFYQQIVGCGLRIRMAAPQRIICKSRPHVVMFPLMAHGHIIPFFDLAKLLAKRGQFIVTIVNTPKNVMRLEPMVAAACRGDGSMDIRLEELQFPEGIEGLPPDVENTDSLPYNLFFSLVRGCEMLQHPFEQLLRRLSHEPGSRPTCVVTDIFFGWSLDVANRIGIPRVTFSTTGAFSTSVYYSLWLHLPHKQTDSDVFSLAPDFPDVWFHKSQLPLSLRMTNETDPWYQFLKRQIPKNLESWGTLLNTFDDLEPQFLEDMKTKGFGRVWSVGPLLPEGVLGASNFEGYSVQVATRGKAAGRAEGDCLLTWLDCHPPSSVLYISFGTLARISYSQTEELALGLEASGHPFIWAVRPPSDQAANGASSDFLPEGFEKRMTEKKQGLLIKEWAPQLLILSHPSIGGFFSHCGWNSIMESISQGVPIIGWPMAADQFYNSKLLEEVVGMSVEICRGVDAELQRTNVESTVKLLMEEKRGVAMKKRAMAMRNAATRAVMSDEDRVVKGSSVANVDDFIAEINKLFCTPKPGPEAEEVSLGGY